jgi:hypothetical protein
MSAFSITPATDVPPPAADAFPNFLTFQNQGTDLGLPDADTLNFSTGLTATRGVGENSNVVTVTGAGAAAATSGVIALTSDVEGDGAFDDTPFPSVWTATVLVANDSWTFDGDTTTLTFAETGVYRVIATCSATAQIEGFAWPDGETHYGSTIDGVESQHYRTKVADTAHTPRWTDQVVIQVDTAPQDAVTQLYALSVDDTGTIIGRCSMTLTIERLGDAPAP